MVVFPAPVSPTIAIFSPFLTVNDKGNEIEMEMFDELNEE